MKIIISVLIFISITTFMYAQDIAGDWQGTLHAGQADLHLVLHITKATDGTLRATLDSVDQGANGIPVTTISVKGSEMDFAVNAVHGSYEGKLNADATAVSGTWSQGMPLPLEFKRSASPTQVEHKAAPPSDIDGAWLGTLDTGEIKLRVVFHIMNTQDGLIASMDSLDQNLKGMPMTAVTRKGMLLKIESTQLSGGYEGNISKDLTTIDGTWTQHGSSMPLVLKLVKNVAELELHRPQNPVKPYPYRDEEVSYPNPAQNVTLAATLTIPLGKGPFPAALLITGSGPQDRDESILGHKPFLVLSDYLTRKGIVVLRADDRGIGKSTGNFATATTADFATDVEAGVSYLKTRSEVDSHEIGLIGHSEGGIIAPMVAARDHDVAFIVMMAGSGVPGDEILAEQVRLLNLASGKSTQEADKDAAEEREVIALVEHEPNNAELEKKLRGKIPDVQLGMQAKALGSPWFRYFLSYDPATALRKVTCPVLAINGEKDTQVSPSQNLPAIRRALEAAGNKNFEVDELPGLNHLFQTAKTGAPYEYAQIEETMSPVALDKIATWILKQEVAKQEVVKQEK
jgi:fermentation-respiration switch protein FrsA (DUF1100 family)